MGGLVRARGAEEDALGADAHMHSLKPDNDAVPHGVSADVERRAQ